MLRILQLGSAHYRTVAIGFQHTIRVDRNEVISIKSFALPKLNSTSKLTHSPVSSAIEWHSSARTGLIPITQLHTIA